MRVPHFILLLLIPFIGWAQNISDTILHKRVLDSLELEIFRYKDSTRRLAYEAKVNSNTGIIDTVFNSKDSITIILYSLNRKILKRHVTYFANDGCVGGEKIEYMNIKEEPEFMITYDAPCYTAEEILDIEKDGGKAFRKLTFYYSRFRYDSIGRVVERVFWAPRVTVRRFIYSYDSAGKPTTASMRIREREFWD